jgi:cation:H+ antiporter
LHAFIKAQKLTDMILQFSILIAGLLLILFGANYLVDGSSSIARRLGLSEFIIGLTIVGIGTSTPEMVVSFLSALKGNADMAIGNIVGSNIFNTMLILGVTAMITPLTITKASLKRDIPLNIAVAILLIVLGMSGTIFGSGNNVLSRVDGLLLLAIFIWYMWKSFKTDNADQNTEEDDVRKYSTFSSILLIAGGLAGALYGRNGIPCNWLKQLLKRDYIEQLCEKTYVG